MSQLRGKPRPGRPSSIGLCRLSGLIFYCWPHMHPTQPSLSPGAFAQAPAPSGMLFLPISAYQKYCSFQGPNSIPSTKTFVFTPEEISSFLSVYQSFYQSHDGFFSLQHLFLQLDFESLEVVNQVFPFCFCFVNPSKITRPKHFACQGVC